jgi:hypothetical protein
MRTNTGHISWACYLNSLKTFYAHTGKPERVAVPLAGFKSLVLAVTEEKRAGVRVRPEFAFVQKKENEAPSLTPFLML